MDELKTCKTCGVTKYLSEFYTYPGGAHRATCKQCALEYQKNRNEKKQKRKGVMDVSEQESKGIAALVSALWHVRFSLAGVLDIDNQHALIDALLNALHEITAE